MQGVNRKTAFYWGIPGKYCTEMHEKISPAALAGVENEKEASPT